MLQSITEIGICEGKMEIREYTEYREEEILRLYTEVGWTAYTKDMSALEQASVKGDVEGFVRFIGRLM